MVPAHGYLRNAEAVFFCDVENLLNKNVPNADLGIEGASTIQ